MRKNQPEFDDHNQSHVMVSQLKQTNGDFLIYLHYDG